MKIKEEIYMYAKNKELTDDILQIVKHLTNDLAKLGRDIKLLKKQIRRVEELKHDIDKLGMSSEHNNDTQAINNISEEMKLYLTCYTNSIDKEILKFSIAWKVAMAMYNHDIEPMASKYGQYENLIEETLKAVGVKKTGDVHRVACLVLGSIKSQMLPIDVCGTTLVQPETQKGEPEIVRYDCRSPVGYRKLLRTMYS